MTLARAALPALVAFAAGSLLSHAQPTPSFRSGVTAVRVDVSVTRGGTPVSGLTIDNFEVRDNGVVQHLEALLVDDVPLSATLVLDTSGSVRGEPLVNLKRAATSFVRGLAPGDRVGLITFSQDVRLRQVPTADVRAVESAIDGVGATGSTAMNDAVYAALRLREPADDRAVAVVFSDGLDNLSWLADEQVVAAAKRSDVIVYGVTLAPEPEQAQPFGGVGAEGPRANDLLRALAKETGGRLWWAGDTRDLTDLFLRTLQEIRARYVLTYYPTGVDPHGWHTVEVRLKGARGEVHARAGYWARPAP